MPRRKQRRRRAKELRHEWEEVYVDEHGREVEVDEDESTDAGEQRAARPQAARREPVRRGGRELQPPSWRRVLKRALVFAPFMFIFMTVLEPETPIVARAVYTAQLILLFIPFSYVVDALMYRLFRRQRERGEAGTAAKAAGKRA